jgi:hypothetical protein
MKEQLFSSWPNATLSIALLLAAVAIVVIALSPLHPLFKAFVLAYGVLP